MAYATSPVQYQINIRPIHMVMAVFAGMLFTVPLVVLLTTSIVGAKTDAVLAAAQQSNQAAVSCVDSAPAKSSAGVDSDASQSNDVAVVGRRHGYVSQSNVSQSNTSTTTSTITTTTIASNNGNGNTNSGNFGSVVDNDDNFSDNVNSGNVASVVDNDDNFSDNFSDNEVTFDNDLVDDTNVIVVLP